MINRMTSTYHEFPRKFWVLIVAMFIDRLGGTLIFPFFALYVTKKFGVGMTEAGVLLAIFSVSGLLGSVMGGALTDKFGRKGMVIFGLVFSALSSVLMGLVSDLAVFYALAVFVGLLSNVAGPAHQAMVADMLPEEKRAEGYGLLRVIANLAWIIGPMIGGLLAAQSYLLLFVIDAISSLITAVIVYRLIPETKPEATVGQPQQSFLKTLAGYRVVAADKVYLAFLLASMLMLVVYQQMYSTLSVYLRDTHGVPEQGFGLLLSLNAGTVVLLQFWVTRRVSKHAPMLMLALGSVLYMIGFTLYGLVSSYLLFVVAMLVITVGEMVVMPVSQAVAARFAPEDMRGRYMAFFTVSWAIPSAVGPWAAGLILDNYDPNWVWYAGGIILAIAATGFYLLYLQTRPRFIPVAEEKQPVPVSP
ncbi:MAG: MFS transporter [Chloroflexi bacterium]|nr:MFS transporter [Chloroflexota bacterium]MBU1747248.1 MFS transporter [Chloroflexota bacterium]